MCDIIYVINKHTKKIVYNFHLPVCFRNAVIYVNQNNTHDSLCFEINDSTELPSYKIKNKERYDSLCYMLSLVFKYVSLTNVDFDEYHAEITRLFCAIEYDYTPSEIMEL